MEFTVTWNEEAYGETEPQTVLMRMASSPSNI